MDFYDIVVSEQTSNNRKADYVIFPDFIYHNTQDIVCKGGELYAFWCNGKWNTSMNDLIAKIDGDILRKKDEILNEHPKARINVKLLNNHSSGMMDTFTNYTRLSNQSNKVFNSRVIFSDEEPTREDYATTKLAYTPKKGRTEAFDEMFSLLYDPHELEKILWFVGALLTNSMAKIEKFMFLYGGKGSGKGTTIKLIEMLFEGYHSAISLHTLTGGSEFATSQIKEVPLLIDSDSDISKIKNDTFLLKLTAHEPVTINIKYRQTYDVIFKGLLVAASNQRFKVRNVDSGITRRAVVVEPTKQTHPPDNYHRLMERIKFELPHIAHKAIEVFKLRGPFYYEDYVNVDMAEATDHIFSFVREHYKQLGDSVTLKKASELYRLYLEEIGFETRGFKRTIKEELKRYYFDFFEQKKIGDEVMYNLYSGFKYDLVFPEKRGMGREIKKYSDVQIESLLDELQLREQPSIFDTVAADYPAQLTTTRGTPMYQWDNVTETLKDINTKLLHYVRIPLNHIIIDLDMVENGEKNLEKNLKKALEFPPTYTELSKSGKGVHLHYIYDGDPTVLESLYEEDVEVKVFTGKQALRRRLTKCNTLPIAHISSGLPIKRKEGINMYQEVQIISWDERKMRTAIENNIKKKYHKNTKPSIDFIAHIFKEAENQGKKYDLRDMRQEILLFAMSSTNQANNCIKIVNDIKYSTIDDNDQTEFQQQLRLGLKKEDLYFYDIEVFPNLLVVVFKKYGHENKPTIWINPSSEQVESLIKLPLVGFNNRRYDNHILYTRLLDDTDVAKCYQQSKRIITKQSGAFYGAAYELSYADIYEYASTKQSLKKWEVDLGILHDELDLPWDQPVPEELWDRVAEYCVNDVIATEAVFNATTYDYDARLILSELSGLEFNAKTQDHAATFIFGNLKRPQDELVYTDLATIFPGYKYEYGKSSYKGIDPSEGGYVYSEPGIYSNVLVMDVESMHPNSAINLNYFGRFTPRFKELVDTRLAIKHKDYAFARKAFDGRLEPYLKDESQAGLLSYSLKIIINIVYGMSSAKYENKFRSKENVDNIVAKRGALFMLELQLALQEKGIQVIHIKTDSIKIPNASKETIKFIEDFGEKYGYKFEVEATYDKFALVNKSVYIANYKDKDGNVIWDPVGAEFAEPYVLKTLFTKEEIVDEDFAQVKQVFQGAHIEIGGKFIGRLAKIYCSLTGEDVMSVKEDKEGHVNKTKGRKWRLFSDYKGKDDVDIDFYNNMADSAYKSLASVGDPADITDYEFVPF